MDTTGLFYLLTREQLNALARGEMTEATINNLPSIRLQNFAISPKPTEHQSETESNPNSVNMAHHLEPPFKKVKLLQEEPEESGLKLKDLPELPFEKMLSCLSLAERVKCRAVSRKWCKTIDSFRPKSLCYSDRPSGFIYRKNYWITGAFVRNFISSLTFGPFFQTFGQSILANLKHLRLCELDLNAENAPDFSAKTLNSFDQLEELGLFGINRSCELDTVLYLHLNLPILKSLQLEFVTAFSMVTSNAPELRKIKHRASFELDLFHDESVEELMIDNLGRIKVKNLKNLKYLYCSEYSQIDSTLLSTLEQLKEIYVFYHTKMVNLFEQKERYGRTDLKIFLCGCLLNGPSDPAVDSLDFWNKRYLSYLAEQRSRLTAEIPLCYQFRYSRIEAIAPGLEIDLLNRFTDLECIYVYDPVQDVDRFLKILKNLNSIVKFECGKPHQELLDRLPDHCAIQNLIVRNAPEDLKFLFKLKSLIYLSFRFQVDIEFIPKVLQELPFLLRFNFKYLAKDFLIQIDHSKQFTIGFGWEKKNVSSVNAVIQWISEKAK